MLTIDEIKNLANSLEEDIISWRQDFHMYPELAYEEIRTSARVAELLTNFGFHVETCLGKTGVVGVIKGAEPGPVRAFRADMDALKIAEKTGLPFTSKHPGVMHACCHDGHTAMLLGLAKGLSLCKEHLKGEIVLIFQPAEEGQAGAKSMLEDGLFEKYPIEFIFGHHIQPVVIPDGTFATRKNDFSANSDRFYIDIEGKSGHAARPHLTVDPIPVMAEVISAVHHIVGRNINPFETSVVTIGSAKAGETENAIPSTAHISGTVRTYTDNTRNCIKKRLEEIATSIPAGYGAKGTLRYKYLYPRVFNDPNLTDYVFEKARAFWGVEHVVELEHPSTGGEDFSFYTQKVPGVFSYLGAEGSGQVHTSNLIFDEKVLTQGVAWQLFLAFSSGDYKVNQKE